jgi:predicted RNase H-like HicB family nuclease
MRNVKLWDYRSNIFSSDADKGYIADIPDLEACSAFGKTPTDALKQAQLAKKLWLETIKGVGSLCATNVTIAAVMVTVLHP